MAVCLPHRSVTPRPEDPHAVTSSLLLLPRESLPANSLAKSRSGSMTITLEPFAQVMFGQSRTEVTGAKRLPPARYREIFVLSSNSPSNLRKLIGGAGDEKREAFWIISSPVAMFPFLTGVPNRMNRWYSDENLAYLTCLCTD